MGIGKGVGTSEPTHVAHGLARKTGQRLKRLNAESLSDPTEPLPKFP